MYTQLKSLYTAVLPYIPLGVTEGVVEQIVEHELDGLSEAIVLDKDFPFGAQFETTVYVS